MFLVAKTEALKVCRKEIGSVPEFGHYDRAKMDWQVRRVDFQLAQLSEWWITTALPRNSPTACLAAAAT
jgi:hypothetical protein